jgi:addiction module RelE/StbE family toxin
LVTEIIWSDDAKVELEVIYADLLNYTKSKQNALSVINDIVSHVEGIKYPEQYQIDEIIGDSYRRLIVRNFRITYQIVSNHTIRVLGITSTYMDH